MAKSFDELVKRTTTKKTQARAALRTQKLLAELLLRIGESINVAFRSAKVAAFAERKATKSEVIVSLILSIPPRLLFRQLPQDRGQNAAVAVILQFHGRVDQHADREAPRRAVGRPGL